jgi:hypothetical protein
MAEAEAAVWEQAAAQAVVAEVVAPPSAEAEPQAAAWEAGDAPLVWAAAYAWEAGDAPSA